MNTLNMTSVRRLLGGLLASVALAGSAFAGGYVVRDAEIRWTGSMPIKAHTGLISLKELEAEIDKDGTIRSLEAVVDMTSINVTDLEGKDRAKLTGHLKSEDFFHVEAHPTSRFVLREHKDGLLHGTLTIRGAAKEVSLPVTITGDPIAGWTLTGDFAFNRMDHGVDYQNKGILGFINAAKSKLIDEMIDVSATVILAPES